MPLYLPADKNPKCRCWPNILAVMLCPFGHLLECHYPKTCAEAECSHWEAEIDFNQADGESDGEEINPQDDWT